MHAEKKIKLSQLRLIMVKKNILHMSTRLFNKVLQFILDLYQRMTTTVITIVQQM